MYNKVFGGSWGSTLSLVYSQSHPDKAWQNCHSHPLTFLSNSRRFSILMTFTSLMCDIILKVTGIILRGIFMLRKKELDWFYQGGAAAVYPDGIFFCPFIP